MSEDRLRAVLNALPGQAVAVRQRLDITHEEVYLALIRLYDQGRARIVQGTRSHDHQPLEWETAE